MRPPEPKDIADALLHATYHAAGRISCGVDVDGWTDEYLRAFLDRLICKAKVDKVRIRGIRMDPATAAELDLNTRAQRYDVYNNELPVALLVNQFYQLEVEMVPTE